MNTRTDVHRPSEIVTADYEFVAFECMKIEGLGDCHYIIAERERIRAHMAETGGKYSMHQHGGNCHVCGAWAIYTSLFYHRPTNTYIRTGNDCGEKIDSEADASAFRASLRDAIQNRAGKAKAQAVLADARLDAAWAIYTGDCNTGHFEEGTVRDIVEKLIKYGSISEKQTAYLVKLVARIENRPAIEAARKVEHDAATPAPVTTNRIKICGTVLSVKSFATGFGTHQRKILIRTSDGWKAYGPFAAQVSIGNNVEFFARLEVSKDDPKFAFFKRATKIIMETP